MSTAPRRARRADANQAGIVAALRQIPGVSVMVLNSEIDLVVGYRGRNFLFEIKSSPKAEVKLSQTRLAREWQGQYNVISTLLEACRIMGISQ